MLDIQAQWLARSIVRQAWQGIKGIRTNDPAIAALLDALNDHCIAITDTLEAAQPTLPVLVDFPRRTGHVG